MNRLRSMLDRSKRSPPGSAPDDNIYPLHTFDQTKNRRIFVTRVMRFNDVLDAEKLNSSLSRLLEIGDWRKLGGQLQHKQDGGLEVRVPRKFSKERPAITFTQDNLDISIHEHPTASRLHEPTDSPSIQPVPADHPVFAARPDFPKTVDDMIRRGLPQLLLHVTSFKDATLVSLIWPHTLTDAFGILALLKNWSLVLAGREDDVSPLLGAREDVLLEAENAIDSENKEALNLESMRLSGLAMVKWGLRYLWYHLRNPVPQWRTVFLPRETFLRIKSQAHRDIAAIPASNGQDHFASEGDILTAWVTQTVALSEPSSRPMTVVAFFNLRARLSPVISSGGLFVQNMLMMTYAFLSAQVLKGSLGSIALAHRRQFQQQTTEAQVLSFVRTVRKDIDNKVAERFLFGEPDSRPIIINSFHKADFIQAADFGPAVIRPGVSSEKRRNPQGTMLLYYYHVFETPLDSLATFYMLGKDHAGNCWLQGNLRPDAWAEMQKRLDTIA